MSAVVAFPPREGRPLDLILFGATGFTGKLVAEYLASRQAGQGAGFSWALAGRSQQKLEEVRRALVSRGQGEPSLAALPLLIADSNSPESLFELAKKTRVVCTTVGPYAKYGQALAAACARAGTDYCDLTGEVPFIRRSIDENDAVAQRTGARIVHCCGFDSLPSDLGVHVLSEHFQSRGLRLAEAKYYVLSVKGGASGGTIASMLGIFEEAGRNREVRALLLDPYSLNPNPKQDRGPKQRQQLGVSWDSEARSFTAPFIMSVVNARVVHRTNALSGFAYGRDFHYEEVIATGGGPSGLLKATGIAAGMGGIFAAVSAASSSAALRRLLARALPQPGEGPSEAVRKTGWFRIRIIGHSAMDHADHRKRAEVLIEGHHDPGYGETSRMLGEAALCLAQDPLPRRGGVLTPAASMGTALVKRLQESGMLFEVRDLP